MDLAVYISELLGLHGEVNVPGIGNFAQIRVDGYYNEQENKFYPPSHKISFAPQSSEDEALAKYISERKNISILSSKYFIDKYAGGLKQQLSSDKVEIAGLGYLYTENSAIAFKAVDSSRESDPSFYGFAPLKVYKTTAHPKEIPVSKVEEVSVEEVPPVNEEPTKEAPVEVLTDEPVTEPDLFSPKEENLEQPEYETEDNTERRHFSNTWTVILLVIGILVLSVVAVYQYYPTLFDGLKKRQNAPTAIKPAAVKPETQPAVKTDSVTKSVSTPDTTKKSSPPTQEKVQATAPAATQAQQAATHIDTNTRGHYELLGGAFDRRSDAEKIVVNYKKMGFDARILDVKGKKSKVTLGTYYTQQEADEAKKKLVSTGKFKQNDIYVQYYKPKK